MSAFDKKYLIILMLFSLVTSVCRSATITKEPKLYHYDNPLKLMTQAEDYMNRNINDSALLYFTAIIGQFPDKIPDEYRPTVISALNGIGLIHYMNGNYRDAYSNFAYSIDLDERADSPGYINLAGLFHYYGDEEKSMEYLKKGFEAARLNNNQYFLCLTFINLVNSGMASGNFSYLKNFIPQFRNSLSDKTTPEGRYGLILADAAEMAGAGKYQQAVECLKTVPEALKGFFMQDRAIFDTHANIGRMFHMANMNDSAMHYMKKAENYALKERQTDMIVEITKEITSLCEATGDSVGWRKYRYKWLELQDSLYFIKGMKEIHNLEMGYEAQRFGKKIEHLTIEKNFRMKLIILSAIGIVFLTVLLIIVLRYNKKLIAKNHDLFQKNLDILALKKTGADIHRAHEENAPADDIPQNRETEDDDSKSSLSPEIDEIRPSKTDDDSDDGDKNIYTLSESHMEALWQRIEVLMDDEEIFCNSDFSMQKLSEMLNSNTKYISQTINWKTGLNFTSYLSEKRIDVACRRFIDNETFGHLTLEAIITGVGYKSRSSFIKTFKRSTGLTPSEYRKIAIEKANGQSKV